MNARRAALKLAAGAAALSGGALFAASFGGVLPAPVRALLALLLWTALLFSTSRLKPLSAFALVWAFGLGWFAPGLAWTSESMIAHGHVPVSLAYAGVALLGLICGFFPALAAGLASRFTEGPARAILAASLIGLLEWVRGSGLVDFGWLTPAYALLDTPWAGFAPVFGAEGVGIGFLLTAGLVAAGLGWLFSFGHKHSVRGAASFAAALLTVLAGWGLTVVPWYEPASPVPYRMIQANQPVADLFTRVDPVSRIEEVRALLRGVAPVRPGVPVLTPEGVLPTAWDRLPEAAREAWGGLLAEAAAPVLHTNFRPTPAGWANSAFWQTPDGGLVINDKRKLVPFGEYVPAGFRWFTDLLGIPMADLAEGAADQPNPEWAGRTYGLLICYENLDGTVLRDLAAARVPDVFLITSNLGWFGPAVQGQHLDMTRMRALEAARPILSVNMNGMSAAVDASGRVLAALPTGTTGVLQGTVPGAAGAPTPYLRWGILPILILTVLTAGIALVLGRPRR